MAFAHAARYNRRNRQKLVWILFISLGIVAILVIAWQWLPDAYRQSAARLSFRHAAQEVTPTPTPIPKPPFNQAAVLAAWEDILKQHPSITVSAELRDPVSGESVQWQSDQSFRAASTTKMIAAIFYLHQVEEGLFDLDDMVEGYTGQFQLQQLINRSNNDSWAAFLKLLGSKNEEAFAHQQEWRSFTVSNNHIAPHDLANLLTQLWNGKVLNQQHRDLLLSYMQNTIDERWIPPAIPEGAIIYHKYGALEDDLHDAAIITYQGHVYILVIMTNAHGAYAYAERAQLFHQLTEAVFNPPTPVITEPTPISETP
jgi:beta-lactamase class A